MRALAHTADSPRKSAMPRTGLAPRPTQPVSYEPCHRTLTKWLI